MKKLLATISTSSLFMASVVSTAMAAGEVDLNPCAKSGVSGATGGSGDIQTQLCKLQGSSTGDVLRNIIIGVLVISAVIALFFLIYGGIKWILSGGDKAKVGEARGTIVAALVGLIITFLAYFILNIVLGLFNLSVSNLSLPKLVN
jgi:hypothetical protein